MLSRAISQLSDHYPVVVVGSGYGGSIMASRLARAGQRVALLERGREINPGGFPDTLTSAAREVQARTPAGHFGSTTGLFDFRLERDMSVLVGCGLGGTSLINANVALRPHADVFADPRWPEALRSGEETLAPFFDLAERWLGSNPYPLDRPTPPKFSALDAGAMAIGESARRPPINVTFRDGPSAAGVLQPACNDCGDCVTGCNVGAKNTVLMNYLPDAASHGAEIFCLVEVDTVVPAPDEAPGPWTVSFRVLHEGRERFRAPNQFVTADQVFLCAGTLGSTEILLRSRRQGLACSDRLGARFSGNGDVLGFAADAARDVRGIGWGRRTDQDPVGPTITGVIDLSDQRPPGRGLVIEEGAIPSALGAIVPVALTLADSGHQRGLLRRAGTLLSSWRSRARRAMTYLVMSADDDDGTLGLDGDHLTIRWKGAGSEGAIVEDNDQLERVAAAIGGTYFPDPLWTKELSKTLISVHPLGGCVMADDAEDGVVDHLGRVYSGTSGTDVHDGLHVLDGSVIPRPLDVNPLLTISALTERAAAELCIERGWELDTTPALGPADAGAADDGPVGVSFSECMEGWFRLGAPDYAAGAADGRRTGSPMAFILTLDLVDLDAVAADPATVVRSSGTVTAPALSPEALTVVDGRFQLMVPQPDQADTWHMRYQMTLVATDGRRFRFDGHKVLRVGPPWRGWRATTTLYVDVFEVGGSAEPIGRGILTISVGDLLRQLSTMAVHRAPTTTAALAARLRFTRAFLGDVAHAYGGVLDEGSRLHPAPASLRRLRLPDPTVAWFDGTDWHDGARPDERGELMLTNYRGGSKGPVLLASGYGMAASSYATPTTQTTLAEHLVAAGYDVWLFDYRAGIHLASSHRPFTIDDIARRDWPHGVAEVRRRTGAETVQVIGHCVGSVSILMAMLSGLDGIRSIVCSQFTTHPVTGWLNKTKNALHVGELMHLLRMKGVAPDTGHGVVDALTDVALRLVPVPRGEACTLPVCRWLNAIYGLTHTHDQLDDDTHRAFPTMFGFGEVGPIRQLATMTVKNLAVDADGRDVYCTHPDRLSVPILFLQGARNYIFRPEGTKRTVSWLRSHNDPTLYDYVELPDYAHLDCLVGRDSARDVYPVIVEHLDRSNPPDPVPGPHQSPSPAAARIA
jgi:cholesterol oxidase